MQKAQESEQSIQRARVSWEQSKEDLEMAKSFIKTNPDTSCLLSNQAAINAFSSILQAHGHFQLPAYSSTEMLNICSSVVSEVEETRPQCEVLDSALNRDLLGHTRPKKYPIHAGIRQNFVRSKQANSQNYQSLLEGEQSAFFCSMIGC